MKNTRKMIAMDSVYSKILKLVEKEKRLPREIVLPQVLFDEFAADVNLTGHSETIWGVPVVAGSVTEITLVRYERWY